MLVDTYSKKTLEVDPASMPVIVIPKETFKDNYVPGKKAIKKATKTSLMFMLKAMLQALKVFVRVAWVYFQWFVRFAFESIFWFLNSLFTRPIRTIILVAFVLKGIENLTRQDVKKPHSPTIAKHEAKK